MVKILLLEDNAVDAFIAQKVVMLSGAEARLEIADDAAQALKLITNEFLESQELPDIILVDQYMPKANGLQFLDAFNALDIPGKEKVTILMLTNSSDPHLIAEAMRRGAHGLMEKPISIPMVTEWVARVHPKDSVYKQNPG